MRSHLRCDPCVGAVMPRTPKLNVYRTAIGFHDAYVAAPSQKAALAAWGSDKDLFARGVAEKVDDPRLAEAALASPGTVIKRSRGSAAEQIAALPPDPSPRSKSPERSTTARKPAARPRPSRDALQEAERALEEAEQTRAAERAEFDKRAAALAREREASEDKAKAALNKLRRKRDAEAEAYDRALADWRG